MAGPASGEPWTPARSAAGGRSIWLIAFIVSIATFMEVLDISIANVSLEHIAGSLSSSYDEATWVLTSYLIANAIAVPISGWLSNVIGRKRFYMLSVIVFTVASLFCGLAQSLTFLIVARVVQGIGGGGLAPSEQAILTQTFPPNKRAAAFAIYGLTVIAAPIFGPTLGGLITDQASWHWVFLLNVPIGVVSLILVHFYVVDPPLLEQERKERLKGGLRVDGLGIVLLVLWLGFQEYTLDRGQRLDWFASPVICISAGIAIVAGVGLFLWEWTRDEPVFDVRLLFKPSYAICIVTMIMTGAVVLGATQLIPQFLQQVLSYTATNAGLAMTFGGVITVLMMPIAGRLSGLVQPKYLILFGLGLEVFGLWSFTAVDSDISFVWIAIARSGLAVGVPFLFVPINSAAYANVPGKKVMEAAAQLNLARNLGGSIAISAAQVIIAQRSQVHQARLVDRLSPGDPNYLSWLQTLRSVSGGAANAAAVGTAQIYESVVRQAQVLSYIDVFATFAIAVAALMPFLLLMKRVPRGGARG